MPDHLTAIADMLSRAETARAKLAPGTGPYTLQTNRIHALHVAAALLSGGVPTDPARAAAPLASLISKSEKAQRNLTPGSWQHAMLERNLAALRAAVALL